MLALPSTTSISVPSSRPRDKFLTWEQGCSRHLPTLCKCTFNFNFIVPTRMHTRINIVQDVNRDKNADGKKWRQSIKAILRLLGMHSKPVCLCGCKHIIKTPIPIEVSEKCPICPNLRIVESFVLLHKDLFIYSQADCSSSHRNQLLCLFAKNPKMIYSQLSMIAYSDLPKRTVQRRTNETKSTSPKQLQDFKTATDFSREETEVCWLQLFPQLQPQQ